MSLHKNKKGGGFIMEDLLAVYYADNAKKLREIVDGILKKFGGLSEKDRDDFYSLANEVFVDALHRYDGQQLFDAFLYICLRNKIRTEITKRNRQKRMADRLTVSLGALVFEAKNAAPDGQIADCFDLEQIVFEQGGEYGGNLRRYLDSLSALQREVLHLAAKGYCPKEIREMLQISREQYADCMAAIRSYRNISILF